MDVPPHPTPSRSGLGRLITSAGPSVLQRLSATIAHIHRHPGAPSLACFGLGVGEDAFVGPGRASWRAGSRLPGLCALAASPPLEGTMVRFVPAPDPAARALKMGLARESSFFLISRFKGMRGVGKRGEAPAACPGKRARAPFPGVGRRSKCSAAWGCAGADRAGISVVSLAGAVPGQGQAGATHVPRARPEESLTNSSDAPGSGQGWSGEVLGWAGWELQNWGPPPEESVNLLAWEVANVLGNAVFRAEEGTGATCVLAGSSQLRLRGKGSSPPGTAVLSCVQARGLLFSQRDLRVQEPGTGQDVADAGMGRDVSRGHITEGIGCCGRNRSFVFPLSPRTARHELFGGVGSAALPAPGVSPKRRRRAGGMCCHL